MTGTLWHLAAACLVFLASHMLVTSTPLRGVLTARLGPRPYLALYSLVSVLVVAWMGAAYSAAPPGELWDAGSAGRYQALGFVFLASILFVSGATTPNPTGFGGGRMAASGPAGIIKVTRHPIMWGLALWASSHIVAAGSTAAVIYFGTFAVLALGGTVLIERRKRVSMGDAWPPFAAATSNLPFAAIADGRARVGLGEIGYGRIAGGVLQFGLLAAGHELVIGVSPLPL